MSGAADDVAPPARRLTRRKCNCKCKCNCNRESPAESGTCTRRHSPPGAARPFDLESLVRILRVSGRRLVECNGEWRVLARGDKRRRALMAIDAGHVERLRSEKLIVASGNGYVLADGEAPPEERPAAGPWVFKAAGVPASKSGRRGFAWLAELAQQGKGPLSPRQALAGLRLIEDTENAARDPMLTMNWDAVPADRNTRGGSSGGLQPHARRATLRIGRIRAALGERDFRIVHAACVERMNLKVLEQRFGLKRLATRKLLPEALETVAEVYDG
jgi:hypothetical protein